MRAVGLHADVVVITSSYFYDVEPCVKLKVPVIWLNRRKEMLEAGAKKPTEEVPDLKSALKLLGL